MTLTTINYIKLLCCLVLLLPTLAFAQTDPFAAPAKGFTNWLPAPSWEHALLSGNGTMGPMVKYQIGEDGALKEWLWSSLKDNHQHRHVSHLYALYDGVDPDFKNNPVLMQATRRVVEEHMKHRRKENGGEMVFGLAQMAFVTAHLEDATTTAELINWLARLLDNGYGNPAQPRLALHHGSKWRLSFGDHAGACLLRTWAYKAIACPAC